MLRKLANVWSCGYTGVEEYRYINYKVLLCLV